MGDERTLRRTVPEEPDERRPATLLQSTARSVAPAGSKEPPSSFSSTTKPANSASGLALLDATPGRAIWKLAVPLTFGLVINAVYSWTDMYFVSQLGETAIAALGFSDQIMFILFTLASGFCIGAGIVIARRIGENRGNMARIVATQAFSFVAAYATLLAIALYLLAPTILSGLGLTGEIYSAASLYMMTLVFGFPGSLITFQASSALRSSGNTVFPMIVLIASAIVNAILAPIFIFGHLGVPALGIQGAAIATAATQWISAAITIYAMYSGRLNLKLYPPTLRFDWHIIRTIFQIGVPASLQALSVSTSRLAIISLASSFGTAAAAAYTIGLRIDVFVFMPVFAVGIAIETLVSQSIGAKRYNRVKLFRDTAIRHLAAVMIGCGVAIYLFAENIASVFTSDPEVIDLTIHYLHIAVFGYLFFSIGQSGLRSLSGAGHSLRSMMIAVATLYLVQIPVAYLLSAQPSLGVTGIFLAITFAYLALAIISTLAVRGERWMYKQL
ncbi:MAG: MATE family efflux transporter [Armatimonadetes bacterium]|nr:MATE family efflux transporter [Armatimonadota bacterium]